MNGRDVVCNNVMSIDSPAALLMLNVCDTAVHAQIAKLLQSPEIVKYASQVELLKVLQQYPAYKANANAANQILEHADVFPQYDSMGTVTGRFSCHAPALQSTLKLQAIRRCFIPGLGRCFVIADHSLMSAAILSSVSSQQ